MAIELTILAWAMVLLLVHIFAAAQVKTKQYGTTWNMGARDENLPPISPLGGRLSRAQANFMETLPIAIVALIGVVVAGHTSDMTALGAWIWLGARTAYLPIYALGIPMIRTLVFLASLVGIGMVLWPLLGF